MPLAVINTCASIKSFFNSFSSQVNNFAISLMHLQLVTIFLELSGAECLPEVSLFSGLKSLLSCSGICLSLFEFCLRVATFHLSHSRGVATFLLLIANFPKCRTAGHASKFAKRTLQRFVAIVQINVCAVGDIRLWRRG